MWLLSWLPGQGTDLHDHGASTGAFAVVSGRLTELTIERRQAGPRSETFRWTPGAVRPFGPGHVHQVTNTSGSPAVSLHVYSPSLSSMTAIASRPRGSRPWESTEPGWPGDRRRARRDDADEA